MDILIDYAMSFVGVPYLYGGDDPVLGFDCSGFVLELLRSCGVIAHSHTKLNAQEIYNLLEKDMSQNQWGAGSIAFFGKSVTQIDHIGFCLDRYRMIEAGGGDATTLDRAHAAAQNAFIKVRLISYRRDLVTVGKPKYATIGLV